MTRSRLRTPAPVRVVFDGQSLLNVPVPTPSAWVSPVTMSGRQIPWARVSRSGFGWDELISDETTRLHPQARTQPGVTDILVMFGGQGDILDLGYTGAQTYTAATGYRDRAFTAGFDLSVICTMPPIGPDSLGTGRPTVGEAQAITDHNTLVRANSAGFDAVADVAATMNDATNTTWFDIDRTHFKAAGSAVAAGIIWPAIASILP